MTIQSDVKQLPARELYAMLWAYYQNNALYQTIVEEAAKVGALTDVNEVRSLRNPANRVVEFYVAKVWPGDIDRALPIETENEAIVEPIKQVWTWSNWAARKQRFMRWYATFGEGFVKVVATADGRRIYHQVLNPAWVSDFDIDERGFLTWLRMDYAARRRKDDGVTEAYWHSEVWDKALGLGRTWDHKRGPDVTVAQLGVPTLEWEFASAGIDFIPIVYTPFKDAGEDTDRGNGAFIHALDKIDEANRQATMLHARLFRYGKPDKALTGVGSDPTGRPLPPPIISRGDDDVVKGTGNGIYEVDGERFYQLPSGWKIEHLVPTLPWADALAILVSHMGELERDLPELLYWRISESTDLSGKAIRMMLSGAIDKALEARGNAEAALVRANQMALTIAGNLGIEGFAGLGSYEAGDFDHSFKARDIIPVEELEQAEVMQAYVQATVPVHIAAQHAGWSPEAIEELVGAVEEQRAQQQQDLQNAMNRAAAAVDKGDNVPEDAGKGGGEIAPGE